jgi:Zn finger protein HypA/HybF involved in hydrogenase expression
MTKKLTITEFIEKSNNIHNNKYDYSLVDYKNNRTKVKIICKTHGEFEQSPDNHFKGQRCPVCTSNKLTIDDFKQRSTLLHNNKYDYSNVNYTGILNPVNIICPIHGEFNQLAKYHLESAGCPKCAGKNITIDDFIKKSNVIHNNKYDYSLVTSVSEKVKIICQSHGVFEQKFYRHYHGSGCPLCRESRGEREIRKILIKNNINYIPQHKFSDCKNKKSLSFDFYLPDNNLCIEYQGRQHYIECEYFGGEKRFINQITNDEIKKTYCTNNNINLIVIPYYNNINDILKTILPI